MPELLLRKDNGEYVAARGTDSGELLTEGDSSDGGGEVSPPSAALNGKTTVTTAGARMALGAATAIKSVAVKAGTSNTGTIYLGNSNVSSSNGAELSAGETAAIDIDDLSKVYIDASSNNQYVTWIAS